MSSTLSSIISALERIVSPDKTILIEAQNELEKAAEANLADFVSDLSAILANQANSSVARQAAGIQLKNCLSTKDPALKMHYQRRWLYIPDKVRVAVRERLLSALGTETVRPSCAAQCLAYFCAAELSQEHASAKENDTLPNLLSAITAVLDLANNERRREAAMEALGFVCQELSPEILVTYSSEILLPIINGFKTKELSERIRLAAAAALFNSLEFIHRHFELEGDRNLIMQVVCDATQSPVVEESVFGLQILVKLATFYYHHLHHYMDQAIVPITLQAIKSMESSVSLQGMEFWCTVAEIEFDLASGAYDPSFTVPVSLHFTEKALRKLVPTLMVALVNWQEDSNELDDLDDWTPVQGAVACLTLLSQCCPDTIEHYILSEVECRIQDPDWRQRVTAIWATSSILDEMDAFKAEIKLFPLLPIIWELTQDKKCAKIRYASLVLMRRIFQACPPLIPMALSPLLKGLFLRLKDVEPKVSAAASNNISTLVEVVYREASKETKGDRPQTNILSRYYKRIVMQLLGYCSRCSSSNLRSDAYLGLQCALISSPGDCSEVVRNTLVLLLQQLKQIPDGEESAKELRALLCSTISSTLTRLNQGESQTINFLDDYLPCLIKLLQTEKVPEEILLALQPVVSMLGNNLEKHLPALVIRLKSLLQSYDLSTDCVAVVGCIFRALEANSKLYFEDFMHIFLAILSKEDIELKTRTEIIAVINDMAMAIDAETIQPFLVAMLETLKTSSECKADVADLDDLYDSILKAYGTTFRFIWTKESTSEEDVTNKKLLLQNFLHSLSKLILLVANESASEAILSTAGTLIGVIILELGAKEAAQHFSTSNVKHKWLLKVIASQALSSECSKIGAAALSELEALEKSV